MNAKPPNLTEVSLRWPMLACRALLVLVCLTLLAGGWAGAAATNAPGGLDYNSFKLITDKNIFNPKRKPGYTPVERTPRTRMTRVDSFSLVGTMSYEKGPFAFFDSSNADFRKVVKPADVIAGYKVLEIKPAYVKLAADTNEILVLVGKQLRREDGGPWHVTDRPESIEPQVASYSRDGRNGRDGRDGRSGRDGRDGRRRGMEGGPTGRPPDQTAIPGLPDVPAAVLDAASQFFRDMQDESATNAPPDAAAGDADAVLLRLMQRRAQENNQ